MNLEFPTLDPLIRLTCCFDVLMPYKEVGKGAPGKMRSCCLKLTITVFINSCSKPPQVNPFKAFMYNPIITCLDNGHDRLNLAMNVPF